MIFDGLGEGKRVFLIGKGNKICSVAKNEFGQWAVLGAILTSFWLLLGCLGEPKMRQSRFQEGVEKNVDFRDPLFSDFG